jgi:hypothetical protein
MMILLTWSSRSCTHTGLGDQFESRPEAASRVRLPTTWCASCWLVTAILRSRRPRRPSRRVIHPGEATSDHAQLGLVRGFAGTASDAVRRPARGPQRGTFGALLQGLQVGGQGLELGVGDDATPVRHAHDRRLADHASRADHVDDLRVGVELGAEVLSCQWGDGLVFGLRVGDSAEAVRAVAVDAAVLDVEDRPRDRGTLLGRDGGRLGGRNLRQARAEVGDAARVRSGPRIGGTVGPR